MIDETILKSRNHCFEKITFIHKDKKEILYLSQAKGRRTAKPLVLYIQGSGCVPHFFKKGKKLISGYGKIINSILDKKAHVLLVEKLGSEYKTKFQGLSKGCSDEFISNFSIDNWASTIIEAIRFCIDSKTTNIDKVLVIGHSEGGQVAAYIAARMNLITHIALLSSTGINQINDLHYNSSFENISDSIRKIKENPISHEQIWGHPIKRWSSFLSTSTLDELIKTNAKIHITHGTSDKSVPVASVDSMFYQLLLRKRDVQYNRIIGGDHTLRINKYHSKRKHFVRNIRSILKWFEKT